MGKVVQRVRLSNGAQTLTLPVPPALGASVLGTLAAARTAVQVAQVAAQKIGDAIGFDEILQGASSGSPAIAEGESLADLQSQFTHLASETLSKRGISANPRVSLRVGNQGQIEVTGDHPQAAQIEAALAGNPDLSTLAKKVLASLGTSLGTPEARMELPLPDDLTIPPSMMNIPASLAKHSAGG